MLCGSTECPRYHECQRSIENGGLSGDNSIANLASYGSAEMSDRVSDFQFACGSLGKYHMFVQKNILAMEKPIK